MIDLIEVCEAADKPSCLAIQARVLVHVLFECSDNLLPQAQMRFLVGNTALNGKNYQQALESFASAGGLGPFSKVPGLETISLVCRLLEWMLRYL